MRSLTQVRYWPVLCDSQVSSPPVFVDESSHGSRAFTRQSGSFHGRQGVYTRRPSLLPPPSSSQLSEPGESRTRPPLPPPSSSSHLFTVAEKHEGGAHTWEDLRLPVEPASIHGEDIPAVNTGMPQRDENMKTDWSEEMPLVSKPYQSETRKKLVTYSAN